MSPVTEHDSMGWLRRQTRHVEERDTLEVSEAVAETVKVEAWLQRRGVKYAPATAIPMAMIDVRRSRQNQARKDPLVTESVDRYANYFRAGVQFPPIVVYPLGNKLVIVDGNNRHEGAIRAKRDYIQGIIIDAQTDGDLIQLLTVEANTTHGVTPPVEWRLKQAFHLIGRGFPDVVAAEAAGVSALQLKNAKAASEADGRARNLKIFGFSDLSATAKQHLNGIRMEPVFHAAGRLAVGQKLGVDQVRELVRAVKAGRSEAEQLQIIGEQAQNIDVEEATKKAMKKGVSSPKNALVSGVGLITKCDPTALVNQIVTAHDRDVIVKRLNEVVDKILEIQVAMETLKGLEG